MSTAFAPHQRVKIKQSTNTLLAARTEDVGKLGIILAIDHPSANIAGGLVIVLDSCHNGLEEKQHRKLRFFDPSQVELN